MQRYSRLSISRPVIKATEVDRITGKAQYFAEQVFSHDDATFTDAGLTRTTVGNPRFDVLSPLEFSLLYRAGYNDGRNRASRASTAEDALLSSLEFNEKIKQLESKYDGLDVSRLRIAFVAVAVATKPGYSIGESQILLLPSPESIEASYLLEEAQICSVALSRVASKFGYPEAHIVPGIPLVRLASDITPEQKSLFVKNINEKVLPATLEIGGRDVESKDKSSV